MNDLTDGTPGLLVLRRAVDRVDDFRLVIGELIVEDDLADAHLVHEVVLAPICWLGYLGMELARSRRNL